MTILLDIFESVELEGLLKQSEEVQRQSLNVKGFADILWFACDNHRVQIEHKTANEVLGDLGHVEDQLRRQFPHAEESMLLIEGIISPTMEGCASFMLSKDGKFYYQSRRFPHRSYASLVSWFWSLDKAGVTVLQVPDLPAMATAIVSMYRNSLKTEHTTLQRYIKEKIHLDEQDPFIKTIMGIVGPYLGEIRAKNLIAAFGSPFMLFNASEEEIAAVPEMGTSTARKLLRAIGRQV